MHRWVFIKLSGMACYQKLSPTSHCFKVLGNLETNLITIYLTSPCSLSLHMAFQVSTILPLWGEWIRYKSIYLHSSLSTRKNRRRKKKKKGFTTVNSLELHVQNWMYHIKWLLRCKSWKILILILSSCPKQIVRIAFGRIESFTNFSPNKISPVNLHTVITHSWL